MNMLARLKHERELTVVLVAFVLLGILVPALHLFLPVGSTLHVPDYMVQLLGKFACFAMVALALDLIWGFTGVLSLGQGVFFSLGAYCMGMYLMRSMAGEGMYKSELPDFMVFLDWKTLPWYWLGFDSFAFALLMALFVPGLLALAFGFLAFRSRIRGVYFSIITQAMTFAMMLLFFRNETGFGGNNGLPDFKRILGFSMQADGTKLALYVITIVIMFASYFVCRALVHSKAGRVLRAIRDAESKVMFCGYNPRDFKLFAWTFAAVLSGLAGALYVPQVGIINPSEMEPSSSIEMAIWVAVGGRGTLVGALLGAGVVNGMKSWLTASYPDAWLYALAALFVLVTLLLPEGLVGLIKRVASTKGTTPKAPSNSSPTAVAAAASAALEDGLQVAEPTQGKA
ncbi:MAG: amino acid transporter permease [Myxococcaceae bacterium]|nr:amino acid transporter permease [Myxococcaceae bacterium]